MSWWERLVSIFRSRYVMSLEARILELRAIHDARIAALEFEKEKLLDRILILTTGAPLVIPEPATNSEEGKLPREAQEPFVRKTFSELLAETEALSFEKDNASRGIPDEIVEDANITNAMIASDEEEGRRQESLRKTFAKNFNTVAKEFHDGVKPILTPQEKS